MSLVILGLPGLEILKMGVFKAKEVIVYPSVDGFAIEQELLYASIKQILAEGQLSAKSGAPEETRGIKLELARL
jgi:hypothetical protein